MSTPGEKLRNARKFRNLSIAQVVKATRIRSYYIEAIEADDFAIMPSATQARGFLRSYADFLGLDMETLLQSPAPAQAEIDQAAEPIEIKPPIEENEAIIDEPLVETPPIGSEEQLPLPEEVHAEQIAQPSDISFRKIGDILRARRELLGLTLEEIERHTRIRKANLQIIENANFDKMASPVQARGMLKAYSTFLDMDSETILLQFADALQMRHSERQLTPPPPRKRALLPAWIRNLVTPDLIFGSILIVSISGLIIWGATRIIASQEIPEEELQAPSIVEVLLEAPTETPTPENIQPISTNAEFILAPGIEVEQPATAIPTQGPGSILQVTLLINERVFLRVIVDGEVKQNGRVAPGAALVFDARERIEVLTGNGNAVQVIYNQIELGTLGNPGTVVNRIYTLDGIQTPTPTVSPTPSNTPRFQPTPTPTLTGTPGITEIP